MWVIFALLDPDPDFDSASRSTDLIESGSRGFRYLCVYGAQVTHYKESILSVVKVLEFIRRKLPYKLVQRIDDTTVDAFLEGWPDNRVRVLLFGKLDIVRYYRYLMFSTMYLAFLYKKCSFYGTGSKLEGSENTTGT